MKSDVARLLAQISAEYEAAERGLQGLSMGNARHDFITKRMEAMGTLCTELYEVAGMDGVEMLSNMLETQFPDQKASR